MNSWLANYLVERSLVKIIFFANIHHEDTNNNAFGGKNVVSYEQQLGR